MDTKVTDNREKVRRGRKGLIANGMDAVRWVAENKLNTASGLERRVLVSLGGGCRCKFPFAGNTLIVNL